MNKIFSITAAIILSSCSQVTKSQTLFAPKSNTVYTAYEYINWEENKDRRALKELMGIDPVYSEWCAGFVNAILKQHDLPTSGSVSEYPYMARSFLSLGEPVMEPQRGDIVVFPRGEPWQGHVGFYVSSTIIDEIDYYYILGGNQNDKVSIELYPAYKALSIRRLN